MPSATTFDDGKWSAIALCTSPASVNAERKGKPTSCNGGRARAPDRRHQIIQGFDQIGYTDHDEYPGGCDDIDVVVPV